MYKILVVKKSHVSHRNVNQVTFFTFVALKSIVAIARARTR